MREGRYFGQIKGAGFSKSKEKKTPQMIVDVDVSHVLNTDANEYEALGQVHEAKVYLYFSDAAKGMTTEILDGLEFNGDPRNPQFAERFTTQGVELTMKLETYAGKAREKWNFYGIGSGPEPDPLTDEELMMISGKLKAWRGKPVAAVSAPPRATPPGPGGTSGPSSPAGF